MSVCLRRNILAKDRFDQPVFHLKMILLSAGFIKYPDVELEENRSPELLDCKNNL